MISPEQTSKEISGNSTDIIVQPYADRIPHPPQLQASLPQTTPLQPAPDPDATNPNAVLLPPPPPGIQLTSLLGSGS
ncbi:hypothetical protein BD626DRAFT_514447, partial [Schizophyllum amplum]